MATQKIIFSVIPNGFHSDGKLRVSIVPSFRLTPGAANEQVLSAFPDVLDWPATIDAVFSGLNVGTPAGTFPLNRIPLNDPEPEVWNRVFPGDLPVAGYTFNDLSRHKLRSYPVRTIVKFLHTHYGSLAEHNGLERPSLFGRDNRLQRMLRDLGIVPTRKDISDWFDDSPNYFPSQLEALLEKGTPPVNEIGIDGRPLPPDSQGNESPRKCHVLPADFSDLPPALKDHLIYSEQEYAFYQAHRFYQRPENARPYSRRPTPRKNGRMSIEPPVFDFHRLVSSFSDVPDVMRLLHLVVDAVIEDGGRLEDIARRQPERVLTDTIQLKLRDGVVDALDIETTISAPATAFWLQAGPGADESSSKHPSRRFVCNTRTPRLHAGLLRLTGASAIGDYRQTAELDDVGFSVTAMDADGAALKTVGTALALQDHLFKVKNPRDVNTLKERGELTYTTSDGEGVAALRSGGLTLLEHGRAEHIAAETILSSEKHSAVESGKGDDIVFFAEDLLRGYRVDVRTESTKKWNSLCKRRVDYRWIQDEPSSPELPSVKDEGYISGASTTSTPPEDLPEGAKPDHYLHEALVKWTGWSLVAPHPGRRIRAEVHDDLGGIQEERIEARTPEEFHPDGNPIVREVHALPDSLPKLRFGETYQFRLRLVDTAGNSLDVDDPALRDGESASQGIPYLRYEPVDAPALSLQARVSEGESLERMVIRSSYDLSASAYLNEEPFVSNVPTKTGFHYAKTNSRHFVPPKTSQLMAEQHGMFDGAFGPTANVQAVRAAYADSVRESGTLFDGGETVRIVTPPRGDAHSPERPLTEAPPEGFRLLPGEYVIHTEATLRTPYLPDPLAAAVALRGVPGVIREEEIENDSSIHPNQRVRSMLIPGTNEHVLIVPLSGEWPNVHGFRLEVYEHPDELGMDCCETGARLPNQRPKWDRNAHLLVVYLRKGEVANVRYSSCVREPIRPEDPDYMSHLAIPWLHPARRRARTRIEDLSELGVHWMVTPDRPLTLVHAVQQPVCAPVFEKITPVRESDQTWVELSVENEARDAAEATVVRYHARSTAKLEVLAVWMEWIDDPRKPWPVRRRFEAQLPEVVIPSPSISSQEPFLSRFDLLGGASDDSARAHTRHEFGDHKFRLVQYSLRATTRFREYLPTTDPETGEKLHLDLTRKGDAYHGHTLQLPKKYHSVTSEVAAGDDPPRPTDDELGAPLLPADRSPLPGSIVPCSKRPAPPKVAYVMPTFRWSQKKTQFGIVSTREGMGLRVLLERPWFSSGEGELLGVVVCSADPVEQTFRDLPQDLVTFVSQWGQDPIIDSERPHNVMSLKSFRHRVPVDDSYFLPEAQKEMVVAAHRVHYDFQRSLWYADLDIDAGPSYNPFVRLALVRLQPHALPGCSLSEVIHTQYAQLLPTREIQLEKEDNSYSLCVYGPAPEFGSASGRAALGPKYSEARSSARGYDKGLNRIELVVQEQKTGFNTDLDWADVSGISLTGDAIPGQTAPQRPFHPATDIRHTPGRRRVAVAPFDRELPTEYHDTGVHGVRRLRHDLLFTGRLAVPPAPQGTRRRLVVREFERHFSDIDIDFSLPAGRASRPAIVERIVYSREFYLLGYEPRSNDHS